MSQYTNLLATINAQIKANGVGTITGPLLNAVLRQMVSVLGDGYRLVGVAAPGDNPGTPDNQVAYLAGQDGTYTNFGGITLSGEVALLVWGASWSKQSLFSIDSAVTPGSGNPVSSDAVDAALAALAGEYQKLVPTAVEGHLAEFDGAGQVRDAGVSLDELPANFAACLYDRRSAGTPQSPYTFRQSGGDGVNYLKRIKGRTLVWNQLVQNGDTEVATISGHQYLTRISGVDAIVTSTGASIAISDSSVDNVFDLTLMFGSGNEPSTVEEFRALFPLPYYAYNAGTIISNKADSIETVGFNQWDEEWESGDIGYSNGRNVPDANWIRDKNYMPVFPNKTYHIKCKDVQTNIFFYDNDKVYLGRYTDGLQTGKQNSTFITPLGCAFMRFASHTNQFNNDICINLSDPSRNGTYEPYWKATRHLGLDSFEVKDAQDNIITINGLKSAGSVYDEIIEGKKYIKRIGEVDLGTLDYSEANNFFITRSLNSVIKYPSDINERINAVCAKYVTRNYGSSDDKILFSSWNGAGAGLYVAIRDTSYTDAATLKTAMSGVLLYYELATPKEYELVEPIQPMLEVDELGTERRLPEDTADAVNAPFESDSNYSVSVANLVRKLSE